MLLPLRNSPPNSSPSPSPPSSSSSSSSKLNPTILFTIITITTIALLLLLAALLLRRFLHKSHHRPHRRRQRRTSGDLSATEALQRQLHHLFHLHDSGLDQSLIDALPVFLYREIAAADPFDCAVCLAEFSPDDKLRLLPSCGHAFHLNCIDTWLVSSSTCPLCRGGLFAQELPVEGPNSGSEGSPDGDGGFSDVECGESGRGERVLVPVRLGKFKNLEGEGGGDGNCAGIGAGDEGGGGGECGSSNLDARRCFSMGSYQYVVSDVELRVELNCGFGKDGRAVGDGERCCEGVGGGLEGKRLSIGSRGESFSVSKIWQWSNKKGKLPVVSEVSLRSGGSLWSREKSKTVGDE